MELFKIFGSILVDDKKAIASLKKTDQEAYKVNKAMNTIGDAGKKVGKFVLAGATIATGAIAALTTKTVAKLDDIDKASQRAGMGAEEWQRWGHVANLNGIEMATMEKAVIRNQRAITQATEGTGKAADAYKRLGVDINGLSSDQVFEKVIKNLADVDDETERNTIANELFGKSYADLSPLLNNTSDEIANQKGELDELGAVIDQDTVKAGAELNDAFTRVKEMFGGLVTSIGTSLIPTFQKISDWVLNNKDKIQDGFKNALDKISEAIDWVKRNSNWLIPVLATMLGGFIAFKAISIIITMVTTLSTLIGAATTVFGFFNTILLANPIGIVIAAIVAIIAIGVLLYKNWDTVKEKASQLWTSIKSAFNGIKDSIMNPMRTAVDFVKKMVDKIKGFFNFKWAFPKLKMPHFKVTGSVNPLKWLSEGTPKIGVDWYKDGGIMTRPTAFGMNGNNIMAGGEAGREAILPLTPKVLGDIGKGIQSTMGGSPIDYNKLAQVISQELRQALLGMGVFVDRRQFGKLMLAEGKSLGVFNQ